VAEGIHHPRFVHRRERAGWTIGFEKRDLLLQTGNRLREHRHIRKPRCLPSFKTFESVDDLVKPILCLRDTERQIIESYRPLRTCLAAQPQSFEAGAHLRNGNASNLRCRLSDRCRTALDIALRAYG
jgi:hypothetical protein